MSRKVGLWLIGAGGGVSTTVSVGLAALKQGATSFAGLVSQLENFSELDFVDWKDVIIGGHEIRKTSAYEEASQLVTISRAIDKHLVELAKPDLDAIDSNIRPGVLVNVGPTITSLADPGFVNPKQSATEALEQVKVDLNEFRERSNLDRVIVINAASTEPPVDAGEFADTWAELEKSIESADCKLPASSLYAIASIQCGMPFVNFTPSLGNSLPAINELAESMGVCHMGHDGKTGETFMKSVLAPAFAKRNLEIMSWVGHNIFGNMDGKVLDDPVNKKTKVDSKDKLLGQILGYHPQSHISIEYIKSLGDWKTAWDHIHFKGFLGTPMILQFTWQGCDSILAAPLVLDLLRFTDLASENGEKGLLVFLSSFFKSPLGTEENDFSAQFRMLTEWAAAQPESVAK